MNYARFAKIPEEILHARQLSLADPLVYAEMAFQAWFTNVCCISQARIATRLGVSRRQVGRSQTKLEAERYITPVELKNRTVTKYSLNSRVFLPRKNQSTSDIMSPHSRKNKKSPAVN